MLILISEATSNSNTVIRQEFRKLRFQMIDNSLPDAQNCHLCWKNGIECVCAKTRILAKTTQRSAEEKRTMNARPEVKKILIAQKLWRWALIGRNPTAFPNCSPSRARRNFSRLFARSRNCTEAAHDGGFGVSIDLGFL